MALNDAQLKDLIVGKSAYVQNNVTGGKYSVAWTADSRQLISNVDGGSPSRATSVTWRAAPTRGFHPPTRSRTGRSSPRLAMPRSK